MFLAKQNQNGNNEDFADTAIAFVALHHFLTFLFVFEAKVSDKNKLIGDAIMFTDTSNNAWHNQVHWLIRMPYLFLISINDQCICHVVQGYIHVTKTLSHPWYKQIPTYETAKFG